MKSEGRSFVTCTINVKRTTENGVRGFAVSFERAAGLLRIEFWPECRERGLKRCLKDFGVQSRLEFSLIHEDQSKTYWLTVDTTSPAWRLWADGTTSWGNTK